MDYPVTVAVPNRPDQRLAASWDGVSVLTFSLLELQELPSCTPLTITLPAAAGVTLPTLGSPANNPALLLSILASKGFVEAMPVPVSTPVGSFLLADSSLTSSNLAPAGLGTPCTPHPYFLT